MKSIKKALSIFLLTVFGISNFFVLNNVQAGYDGIIDTTIKGMENDLKKDKADGQGAAAFNNQIISIISYFVNVFIAVGVAVAFFGAYKIMTSEKEETMKEGIRLVIFGVIGVIIMVSAKFISNLLVGDSGIINEVNGATADPDGVTMSQRLYKELMFPFLKIVLYLVVGFLFFVTVAKTITFATSTDESAKKKAGGVILWCAVGVLIIIGSKQLVEAIMGKQEKVISNGADWVDSMGNGILKFESIPLISQVINWVLGITTFIIVVLIVVQAYKMFTKPDDPKNRESLKKTILYIFIGVLVIGSAYIISNVLVLNRLGNLGYN